MIGVELPWPGILTFHLIFWVALHWVGGLPWVTVPLALGPRHVGHWLAACRLGVEESRIRPVMTKKEILMVVP